jgi:hypothetical protein
MLSMLFKYTTTFTATARVINPTEEDRFIAKASLAPLKSILPPDINPEDSPDLLFISCNGAVAGLVNKNDDGISNEDALAIHDTAKNKYITTDHDRSKPVGVVLYPGFSKFGTNEPLTFEQSAALKEPFNMAFAGVLWKTINPMLSKYIRNNADDSADSLSMSWEIAFNSYSIGVGSRNLFDAEIIKPEDPKFAAYDRYLRVNKGDGKDPSGKPVFRIIGGQSMILGYSIVPNPAAEVKGIFPVETPEYVKPKDPDGHDDKASEIVQPTEICQKSEEKNITPVNASVNPNTENTMSKITNLQELEAALSKFEGAASVIDFVKSIEKGATDYLKNLEAKENLIKTTEEARAANEKRAQELEASLEAIKKELSELKEEAAAQQTAQKFQERMNAFAETFDLDEEDIKLIAKDITSLDDESFAAYMSKCKKLLAGKAKKKADDKKEDKKEDDKSEAAKKGKEDDSAFNAEKGKEPKGKNTDDPDDDDEDGDDEDGEKDGKKKKGDKASKASETKAEKLVREALASIIANKGEATVTTSVQVDTNMLDEMKAAFADSFKIDGKSLKNKKTA